MNIVSDGETGKRTQVTLEKIRLSIAQIGPGMKLAEAITNANGVTLMPAGIRLTPMFIARIKKWNIESLDVLVEKKAAQAALQNGGILPAARPYDDDDEDDGMTEEQEAFARSLAIEVSRPFVNVRDNPLMLQLRAAVIRRLVAQGPDNIINVLRRPPDRPPLPDGGAN